MEDVNLHSTKPKRPYRMIGEENTIEDLRELIAVPAWTKRVLIAYARAFPEEAPFIERLIKV